MAECFANLECKVVETRLVNKYNLFVLEVLAAWKDPAQKIPRRFIIADMVRSLWMADRSSEIEKRWLGMAASIRR